MVRIVAPKEYVNQPDILNKAGEYISRLGKNILILGSKKSIEVTKDALFQSLAKSDISYTLEYFSGYPTLEKAKNYVSRYENRHIDAIVGIGGGRVIDTSKVTGTLAKIPVITIPTIAATCASWAAVSILYDDNGSFKEIFINDPGPTLILADTKIIINAPVRYTYAGVIDTFAKWFEIIPYLNLKKPDADLMATTDIAKRAFQLLRDNTFVSIEEAEKGIVSNAAFNTVDSIIFLAGLTGSIKSGNLYYGIAHTFYNLLSIIVPAPHLLHGEKVAFGLLLQKVIQHAKLSEIDKTIQLFSEYSALYTLEDFGIVSEKQTKRLAEIINNFIQKEYIPGSFIVTEKSIEDALYETNNVIHSALDYQNTIERRFDYAGKN